MSEQMIVGRNVLGKRCFSQQKVDVPEWGGAVLVRELSSAEIATVRTAAKVAAKQSVDNVDANSISSFERLLVEFGWIDESGQRVLEDGESALLAGESARIVNTLASHIATMSGLNPNAVTDAKKN